MQKQSSRGVLFKEIPKTKNKNFEKIVGEHPRQSLPHNKTAGLSPARYQKRQRHSPMNPAKPSRTRTFTEHLQWLLQNRSNKC